MVHHVCGPRQVPLHGASWLWPTPGFTQVVDAICALEYQKKYLMGPEDQSGKVVKEGVSRLSARK